MAVVPRWNVTPTILMESADEAPDLGSQNLLHRNRLGPDHMDVDIPAAERGRHLEADKARANHHVRDVMQALETRARLSASVRR